MKKAIALILAPLLLLSMTACRLNSGSRVYLEPYESETEEYESPDEYESPVDSTVPDSTEEESPALANMVLTDFLFYSDGVAWATSLGADGQESTHAVDKAGNILFTREEKPYYTSDFYDGVAYYRVRTKGEYFRYDYSENLYLCYEVIVDKQGNELYRTEYDLQNPGAYSGI